MTVSYVCSSSPLLLFFSPLLLISVLLEVSTVDILFISIVRLCHGLSVLSLLQEIVINTFKYNQIRKPISETSELIQKIHV